MRAVRNEDAGPAARTRWLRPEALRLTRALGHWLQAFADAESQRIERAA